ncbi:alpha/beta hydrolase [Brevundimonas diminuta]|uniref:Alpha/beta hydrolase n=2 Tax=Brevundimonas diminuta TaxID=293 RepID=A0A410NY78_BREDI|nr:alpha/beta hydrolase [Brevundimonas diminuta]MBD3572297.1 alpha/beta hydrolase [Brevundimonas diminuta]QAT14826.1 alpha/beta hydrolase [Brevundimonas diminuta]QQB87794.1 alpha/beta hydrolase [Brevundimonas diminuta]GEC00581.1 alpha/beta hydrolase [Brevundimonas diminuta]
MHGTRMIIVAAAAISVGGCSVNVPENAFLYPDARIAAEKIELTPGPAMPRSAQTLTLPYAGGQLATTRLSSTKDDQAPLILFCGGNMFRQSAYGGLVGGQLAAFGDVLLFDYPGYGASTGASDIASMKAAVAAMAARARAIADQEQRRLILWGHSLGGTVCAEGAVNAKADVLVLETTTPSANAVIQEALGWKRFLIRVRLAPPLAEVDIPSTLADYPGRIIVLEAGRDTVLPPVLSRRLVQALTAEGVSVDHLVFAEAGHNDVHSQPDFTSRMAEALARP